MADGIMLIVLIGVIGMLIVIVASWWVLFKKAGKPGWAAIIPIYNILVLLEIIGRPWWWLFLFFLGLIPVVGFLISLVVQLIVNHDLARSFGKGWGYAIGMTVPFVNFAVLPMLAFGDSTYKGPAAKAA